MLWAGTDSCGIGRPTPNRSRALEPRDQQGKHAPNVARVTSKKTRVCAAGQPQCAAQKNPTNQFTLRFCSTPIFPICEAAGNLSGPWIQCWLDRTMRCLSAWHPEKRMFCKEKSVWRTFSTGSEPTAPVQSAQSTPAAWTPVLVNGSRQPSLNRFGNASSQPKKRPWQLGTATAFP